MPRRLLNIASIVCLVLCVALMGLWQRSYSWLDELRGPYVDSRLFGITSMSGTLVLSVWPPGLGNSSPSRNWMWATEANPKGSPTVRALLPPLQFDRHYTGTLAVGNFIPYWFLLLITGSLAMVFRLGWPWRFTLHSLFIATTFLAVVLGMIACLDRSWIGK